MIARNNVDQLYNDRKKVQVKGSWGFSQICGSKNIRRTTLRN